MNQLQIMLTDIGRGIVSRTDEALYAVIGIILLQIVFIAAGHIFKKTLPAYSLAEGICRPVAVFLNDKLNRQNRSDFALIIRGIIVAFLTAVIIFTLGIGVEHLSVWAGIGAWMDPVLLMVILSPLAAVRLAYQLSFDKPAEGVYLQAARALNQNIIHADIYGHRRSAFRLMTLALGEWCLAPLFFYLIGGIPVAYMYVALSLFCRVTGNARASRSFLSVMLPIWYVATLVPTMIGILKVAVASVFAVGGHPLRTLKAMRYIYGGQGIEAAYAYSQNIVLGGAEQDRSGDGIKRPWIGPEHATAKLSHQDVLRGCVLHGVAVFLVVVGLLAAHLYL